jgi:hypothetical protein
MKVWEESMIVYDRFTGEELGTLVEETDTGTLVRGDFGATVKEKWFTSTTTNAWIAMQKRQRISLRKEGIR